MAPVVVAVLVLLVLGAAIVRRSRAAALAGIRAQWGQPVVRERRMETMAASHRSRVSSIPAVTSLDDRTWEDLNLDEVFAALDRTESMLGQYALYHRLRSAPVADQLDVFEALVSRMDANPTLRERAQTALSRLRDPQGYDLWWLGRPDAIDAQPWHVIFPVLTIATVVLLALAAIFQQPVPLVVALAMNVAVRTACDRRIGALAATFRQLAP